MRINSIELYKVKSFDSHISINFDDTTNLFALSGKNGAGKSTILKSAWLVQKVHFCKLLNESGEVISADDDALRFLNGEDSFISLKVSDGDDLAEIKIYLDQKKLCISYENENLIKKNWNLNNPTNLILFIDASKGFSEDTLKYDEINISKNDRNDLSLEAILRPESLFAGIYRQLVKDHVHGRLIPSKPDRLLYFRVAAKMFTTLIPTVELKNFSGNHKPGEFVLLGKANIDRRKPLYDVREFSSGEKALLSTLAFLCISKSVSALIIDEPENHFHESLLLEFMSMLNKLCEQGGVLKWASSAAENLKDEWLEKEYKDHNLSQILISTHSKSLIYKVFSMGQNFTITDKVNSIAYDEAENELRKLGLSSIYTQVILVEGIRDNEALEHVTEGRNITIRSLNGSNAVIDAFKRLAEVRHYIHDSEFVFLVDSDNKPDDFFKNLEDINSQFFHKALIKLDKHELENYFLDAKTISLVVSKFLSITGEVDRQPTEDEIAIKIIELAKESLPQVYKKEISLAFQHSVSNHFSGLTWGNKNFEWGDINNVTDQIAKDVLSNDRVTELHNILRETAKDVFDIYEKANPETLIDRCDGKQVLGKLSAYYAKHAGIEPKAFKKAIFKYAFSTKGHPAHDLAKNIMSRFS